MNRLSGGLAKPVIFGVISLVMLMVIGFLVAPMMLFASASSAGNGSGTQPPVSTSAQNSIPANYLAVFKTIGAKYRVPWVILAGIAKVESDDGQTTLPGVHSGANAFGAAVDANGDGVASVYEPADAIAGAAKYLLEHGILDNVSDAIFAYNHLESYVQSVLGWANTYAKGGFSISPVTVDSAPTCIPGVGEASNNGAATAIAFAEQQLGKSYQWGGTGPDAFDCSGLVMEAYRAAGIDIPRTSELQWRGGPKVPAADVEPGDLVFFIGADGSPTAPGHVGLVIGGGMMIEAFAPGFPIRIAPYGNRQPIGFVRPWAHSGVHLAAAQLSG